MAWWLAVLEAAWPSASSMLMSFSVALLDPAIRRLVLSSLLLLLLLPLLLLLLSGRDLSSPTASTTFLAPLALMMYACPAHEYNKRVGQVGHGLMCCAALVLAPPDSRAMVVRMRGVHPHTWCSPACPTAATPTCATAPLCCGMPAVSEGSRYDQAQQAGACRRERASSGKDDVILGECFLHDILDPTLLGQHCTHTRCQAA